ncbi:MAG: ATP-binding protein [Alistipes senegalensis]|nr:ATP-binding protein [Oxalobacter formigenes]MCM1281073.1 ATP-binding protein [Alistipes senegalensis]
MDFELSVPFATKLLLHIQPDTPLAERLSSHGLSTGRIIVPAPLFNSHDLLQLNKLAKEERNLPLLFQIIALRNILQDKNNVVVTDLELLLPALASYLAWHEIDGWVYSRNRDGILLPWLVDTIEYIQPPEGTGRPYVSVKLLANTMQSANRAQDNTEDPEMWRAGMTNAILFFQRDLGTFTIPELLARKGYFRECPEFKAEYETQLTRFKRLQPLFGKQFHARNYAFIRDKNSKLDEFSILRLPENVPVRCINDEEMLNRRIETNLDRRIEGMDRHAQIPLHCYLYVFHLELHENIWVHVQNLEEYTYRPELRDKLILPKQHRLLVDILTSKIDMLMDDIIEGKSGGTTILCMGAPGLGKTLTAEVYSEVVGKPLYRVHSGQLGTSAESVESALSTILRRATRWDCILLLDEADVYIRQRDNDMQHNAIVAEFLRTLEYFDGLLFMTTNRVNDVDDAILSRCIAVIRYETPSVEDAALLWHSLAEQFGIPLPDSLIEELVQAFPNSSGRDIKELLKLTGRFCAGMREPLSLSAFLQCATFRGKNSYTENS